LLRILAISPNAALHRVKMFCALVLAARLNVRRKLRVNASNFVKLSHCHAKIENLRVKTRPAPPNPTQEAPSMPPLLLTALPAPRRPLDISPHQAQYLLSHSTIPIRPPHKAPMTNANFLEKPFPDTVDLPEFYPTSPARFYNCELT